MKIRRSLLKDTVTVETYQGDSAYGPVYAAAVSVCVNVDSTRRLVRDASGAEVTSEATLSVHPSDASLFAPESRLEINGRASTVINANLQSFRGRTVYLKVTCS